MKLGPSKDFLAIVKILEKMEKEDASAEAKTSTSKPSQKGKRATSKSRRSTRSNSGMNVPDAFPLDPDAPF